MGYIYIHWFSKNKNKKCISSWADATKLQPRRERVNIAPTISSSWPFLSFAPLACKSERPKKKKKGLTFISSINKERHVLSAEEGEGGVKGQRFWFWFCNAVFPIFVFLHLLIYNFLLIWFKWKCFSKNKVQVKMIGKK